MEKKSFSAGFRRTVRFCEGEAYVSNQRARVFSGGLLVVLLISFNLKSVIVILRRSKPVDSSSYQLAFMRNKKLILLGTL